MKPTKGRIRALEYLSRCGAYALPSGYLIGELYTIQPMLPVLLSAGMICEGECKGRKGYVFKITEKGLNWIKHNRMVSE